MNSTKMSYSKDFQCKFCGAKFHKEATLSRHMCVKKRRYVDINSTGSRLGFRTFQRFYELSVRSKQPKSHDDFINSQYYIEFVKFGNHLAVLKPIHTEKFIDFVIFNSVKLKDWTKDFVYELYIDDLVKKEPADSAADRTIVEIASWCEKNNVQFTDFFKKVSANEGAYLVKTGKISPWVLYLATSAEDLQNRFTEDHSNMIGNIIDPAVWMKKFKKYDSEVTFIKSLLEQAGL